MKFFDFCSSDENEEDLNVSVTCMMCYVYVYVTGFWKTDI